MQDNSAATDKYDYECGNGEGWVKDLQTPVWDPLNTDEACWSNDACESGVCVVTNVTDTTLGTKVTTDRLTHDRRTRQRRPAKFVGY